MLLGRSDARPLLLPPHRQRVNADQTLALALANIWPPSYASTSSPLTVPWTIPGSYQATVAAQGGGAAVPHVIRARCGDGSNYNPVVSGGGGAGLGAPAAPPLPPPSPIAGQHLGDL